MKTKQELDPAAILGIAMSLYNGIDGQTRKAGNVSEAYNGADQFMRECMALAERFERWACVWVDFTANTEVWPYLMQDKFHKVYAQSFQWDKLAEVGCDTDCQRIAAGLGQTYFVVLPCIAVEFAGAARKAVEQVTDDKDAEFFGLYRVGPDGLREHVSDHKTRKAAVRAMANA